MKQIFVILSGLIILVFMGTVLWQLLQTSSTNSQPVVCTTEAKMCPDGSAVSRTGPSCEFEECSSGTTATTSNEVVDPIIIEESKSIPPVAPPALEPDYPVACTMDAKECPDGSYVGRTGPNCEFAQCPTLQNKQSTAIECSPESRMVDFCAEIYAPVCGLVEVQCVTTPCNPVPETFSNGCFACMDKNVLSYTEGSCESSQ